MEIQLIKDAFITKFSYLNFTNKAKHAILGLTVYNADLSKKIQIEAEGLKEDIQKANNTAEFFTAIIDRVATVYALKQQTALEQKKDIKKGDFEEGIVEALKNCKGKGNKYFDAAIDGIIERIEMLPDDFYKDASHHPLDNLKDEIVNFFTYNRFTDDYLIRILTNKQSSKAVSQNTVFYIIQESIVANSNTTQVGKGSFINTKPRFYWEKEKDLRFYDIKELYPLIEAEPAVTNQNLPIPQN